MVLLGIITQSHDIFLVDFITDISTGEQVSEVYSVHVPWHHLLELNAKFGFLLFLIYDVALVL